MASVCPCPSPSTPRHDRVWHGLLADAQQGRPRAPTITIDTSAVGQPPQSRDDMSDNQAPPISPQPPASSHLSVPTRNRGGSVDTNNSYSTTTSDVTYVNSPTDRSNKAFLSDSLPTGAGGHPVLPDDAALKPDPGTEADFQRDENPFAFAPGHMTKLVNPKSLGAFHAVGGLPGLEKGLRTNLAAGLSLEEAHLPGRVTFEDVTATDSPSSDTTQVGKADAGPPANPSDQFGDRRRIFLTNKLPERKAKNILQLAWMAYNDKILILLTAAAAIALALGLYSTFGQEHEAGEPNVEWVEGVAIIVAIIVVVGVGALNDWQKERQFVKLNKKKDNRNVKVCRSGQTREISVHDILVGDILLLETGDMLSCDGVLVESFSIKCDESSATGESDLVRKSNGYEVYRAMEANENLRKLDPFIISGAKVTEGVGRMLVTGTGVNSLYGKTMMALREENDPTPLQKKLNKLADQIAKLGSSAALLLFVVLLIKFLADLPNNDEPPAQKGRRFMDILIVAVTIVVVAVPEGLPLAVTLALAFATRRMLKEGNLVRVLRSCETMGNATNVCTDKTGTLTQNVMTVVTGSLGVSNKFNNRTKLDTEGAETNTTKPGHLGTTTAQKFVQQLHERVSNIWRESIVINSTAFENDEGQYVGSKTETALLDFARTYLGMESVQIERSNASIVQIVPFDSSRKCMAMVVKLKDGSGYRLMVKGASEIMLGHCSNIIQDPTAGIGTMAMTSQTREVIESTIESYATDSLRTIGFVYRDFASWPPKDVRRQEDDPTMAVFGDVLKEMTWLGLVGIQDPLREGVIEAVEDAKMAGIFVRMVTGDNIMTAKAIARECGILHGDGIAMEGPLFRTLSEQQQRELLPTLQVLSRSSPEDKRILVKLLKDMGETVAVTGDGTNDAPALKTADVGFAMNIAGTEVAKEASDIVLMNDNFAAIIDATKWGRSTNDAVRKFLQFQLTVNITAVLLAFVSAVSSAEEESVLTAVQLLWINLIMDTMAALALATDPPTRKILNRKPDPKSAPLISLRMWKMIIGQAIYQLIITFILYYAGTTMFHFDEEHIQTLVFNTFTWMQIFNAFNNRRLDNNFNIFEGIHRNLFFVGILCVMIGGQVLIIFVGGAAFRITHQNKDQWAIAIVCGAVSLLVGVVVRLVPDEIVRRFWAFLCSLVPSPVKRFFARFTRKKNADEENSFAFQEEGLYEIKRELAFIKKYKGGRLNNLKFTLQHPRQALIYSRSPSRSRLSQSTPPKTPDQEHAEHLSAPPTPSSKHRSRSRSNSALAGIAMAGVVAGSVAGWSPIDRRDGDGESLRPPSMDRSVSSLSSEPARARTPPAPSSTSGGGLAPDVQRSAHNRTMP
ncbi:hypothetical protein MBLNU230_g6619t1 [Neophaeotheca triangularis]